MTVTPNPVRRERSRRRLLMFAAVACAGGLLLSFTALLLLDLWVHRKFDQVAGVNIWGYRGPTVGRKASGEYRVVVLGASTVFGYGVAWSDAFPAQLERKLRAASPTARPFSVVNLGYNNEGAYSFPFTLRDYAYLKPDLAILYAGYSEIYGLNTNLFRRESYVFRLTGYYPLLPLVAREKVMALRYGGDLEAAYRAKNAGAVPIIFRPTTAAPSAVVAHPASAAGGGTTAEVGDSKALERSTALYHEVMTNAVAVALEQGTSVLIVGQPYYGEGNVGQQQMLQQALVDRFGQRSSVRYVDLSHAVDVHDASLAFDQMHLTIAGNGRVADSLLAPTLDMATRSGSTSGAQGPR